MASGEGALATQQQIAAREPYENIALGPADKILNAFALGVEINRRRSAMEAQMQRLVLQHQKMDQDRSLKEEEFGMKQTALEASLGIREANMNLAAEKFQFTKDKLNDQIEDTSGLYNSFTNMKSKPGDPEFPSELNSIMANHSRAAMTANGRSVQKLWETQHNNSVAKQTTSVKSDYDLFLKDVSHRMFGGGPADVTMFDIPQVWQPQYAVKGQTQIPGPDGKPIGVGKETPGATPTGMWIAPAGVEKYKDKSGTFTQHFATISESEKNDFLKRYQDIRQRMNKLPSQIVNPETGTQPIQTTAGLAPPPQTSSGATSVVGYGGHHYEVDHSTKQVIRQID